SGIKTVHMRESVEPRCVRWESAILQFPPVICVVFAAVLAGHLVLCAWNSTHTHCAVDEVESFFDAREWAHRAVDERLVPHLNTVTRTQKRLSPLCIFVEERGGHVPGWIDSWLEHW